MTPRQRLQAAIDAYKGDRGPGEWEISIDGEGTEDERVSLAYKVEIVKDEHNPSQPHPRIMAGDEPYLEWGGNAIIAAAGMMIYDGCLDAMDGYYYDIARLKETHNE